MSNDISLWIIVGYKSVYIMEIISEWKDKIKNKTVTPILNPPDEISESIRVSMTLPWRVTLDEITQKMLQSVSRIIELKTEKHFR